MKIAVCAALIAVFAAEPALAQPQKKAQHARPAKISAPAKPSLASEAAKGDAAAQLSWGMALLSGKGAKKDHAEALRWLNLSAAGGSLEAALELAKGWEKGWFGKADPSQAALWWFQAGTLGDADARNRFIELYLSGNADSIGGPSGIQWLEPVAESGDLRAIMALARIYESGGDIVTDHAKAQRWYRVAAFSGDAEAQFRLGRMLLSEPGGWRLLYKDAEREKDNTERDVLYSTREEAVKAAGNDRWVDVMRPGMLHGEYWLDRAAAQGHALAARTLGEAYLNGLDLPVDMAEASRRLSQAALAGDAVSMKILADLAAQGLGLFAADPVRAWVNYDMAAGSGLQEAAQARDVLAKTMTSKQLTRSRQIAGDLRNR